MLEPVALADRAPEWLRRLVYRIAAGQGFLGRLADAVRFRFSEDEVPSPPPPSDAAVRLLIGPANSAGQGYRWAQAVHRYLPDATAVAMRGIGTDPFTLDVDLRVPVAVYQRSRTWHAAFERYLGEQTHVIWESGLPLLGREHGSGVVAEARALRERGVAGALMFHGSDIRPPSLHAIGNPWSPFPGAGAARALEETAARNLDLAAASGLPSFVSTPDLLQWLPQATWCPVVVDTTAWHVPADRKRGGPLVVVHAPSNAWLKGTALIEPVLRRLAAEGVIEYRQAVGIPHASMGEFYANADVVLDQFVLGIYGVAACEAMATGRIVMSHVDEFTRAQVIERTGLELPVHETTLESLERDLRRAAVEPEAFEALKAAGPAFVEEVHDGRLSAAALAPFLGLTA